MCYEIVPINLKLSYLYALKLHSQKDLLLGYTTAKSSGSYGVNVQVIQPFFKFPYKFSLINYI